MRIPIAIASLVTAALAFPANAEEQQANRVPCGARTEIVQSLADQFGETPREIGLLPRRDMVLELFASGEGLTWTLILSYPDGRSCLFASGTDWGAAGHALLGRGPSQGS